MSIHLDDKAKIKGVMQAGRSYGVLVKYNPDLYFIARQVASIENANTKMLDGNHVVVKYEDNGLSSFVRCYNQAEAEKGLVRYAIDPPQHSKEPGGFGFTECKYWSKVGPDSAINVMPTDWIIFSQSGHQVFSISDFDFEHHMKVHHTLAAQLIADQRQARIMLEISENNHDRVYGSGLPGE